jgi:hypothetical protein
MSTYGDLLLNSPNPPEIPPIISQNSPNQQQNLSIYSKKLSKSGTNSSNYLNHEYKSL